MFLQYALFQPVSLFLSTRSKLTFNVNWVVELTVLLGPLGC